MDALVMCGGRGSRLESELEKPLFPVAGVPMIDRVMAALEASAVDRVYAVVSPHAPETRRHLETERAGVSLIETPGEGYVADLLTALADQRVSKPVLTVAADLALLEAAVVDRVIERYAAGFGSLSGARSASGSAAPHHSTTTSPSLTVCVPVALKRRLGVSVDTTLEATPHLAPTGLNVVGSDTTTMRHRYYDSRLAVNVNRLGDTRRATEWLTAADADARSDVDSAARSESEDRCD